MSLFLQNKKLDLPHNFHQLHELFPLQENTYFFVCSQSSDKQTFGDNY